MTHTSNLIRIELKYCELCGGLFFRRQHSCHTLCTPCVTKPSFLLRDCDPDGAPHLPPLADVGKSPAQQQAAWYGPMTETIHRLDAVAESNREPAWSAGDPPATQSSELANQALPATCSASQPFPGDLEPSNAFPVLAQDFSPGFASHEIPQSRRDGWMPGGAA